MRIHETAEKAEKLTEMSEAAKRRQNYYRQAVNSARTQVMEAYKRLEAAQSETDEEGKPTGDVSGARADLRLAQAMLDSAESGLASVTAEIEGINKAEMKTLQEIEEYNTVEKGNLAKLRELQKKRFGSNVDAFIVDLTERMNLGEQARQQLLQSMGISAARKSYSVASASGGAGGLSSSVPAQQVKSEEPSDSEITEAVKSVVDQNVMSAHLPHSGGEWSGKKGNSEFVFNDDAVIKYHSKKDNCDVTLTGKELKAEMSKKYGVEGVSYFGKEPNFEPFEDALLGHAYLNSFSTSREGSGGTYASAKRQIAAGLLQNEEWVSKYKSENGTDKMPTQKDAERWIDEYMKENDLVFHECADRHTVRVVPSVINTAFKHSGGISTEQSVRAMGESWRDTYEGELVVQRNGINGQVNTGELHNAIAGAKTDYAEKKREQNKKGKNR